MEALFHVRLRIRDSDFPYATERLRLTVAALQPRHSGLAMKATHAQGTECRVIPPVKLPCMAIHLSLG